MSLTLSEMTNFGLFQTEEFTDNNNCKFDKYGRKFSKRVETLWEKEKFIVTAISPFFHSVFKRLVLQTCKTKGLFGKELNKKRKISSIGRI